MGRFRHKRDILLHMECPNNVPNFHTFRWSELRIIRTLLIPLVIVVYRVTNCGSSVSYLITTYLINLPTYLFLKLILDRGVSQTFGILISVAQT